MEEDCSVGGRRPFINDWPWRRHAVLTLGTLVLLGALTILRQVHGEDVYTSLAGLFLVPFIVLSIGAGLLRVVPLHCMGFVRSLFLSFALGLGALMLLGAGLNLFHYIGLVEDPLRLGPIIVCYAFMAFVIMGLARWRDRDHRPMPAGPSPDLSEVAIWTFAAALPLMVTLAAARINSTSDYALMAFAVFVLCLVPLGVLCRPRSYAPLVLSLSMGLLLHRALITNYLIGYDIFSELSAARITTVNGWWNVSQSHGLYGGSANTALSVVALAPVLTNLTGIQTVELLKFVYPLMFSIVPLGIYQLISEQFGPRPAFLGAGVFMGYQAFFGLMIQLAKQQLAELFIVAFLLSLTDRSLSNRHRMLLSTACIGGVMVSHYGLAFLMIILMGMVVGLQALAFLYNGWKDRRRDWKGCCHWASRTFRSFLSDQFRGRVIGLPLLLFATCIFLVWYSVTGSGMVLGYVGLGDPPSSSGSDSGPITLSMLDALEYLFIDYGSTINNLNKYVVLMVQMVMVIGVVWVFRDREQRRSVNSEYLFLGAASSIFMVLCYMVPGISASLYYGRMFTFLFIFLSGFLIIGAYALVRTVKKVFLRRGLRPLGKEHVATAMGCTMVLLLLFGSTGSFAMLSGEFVGSYSIDKTASWALYTDSDVAAAKWVSDPGRMGDYTVVADWHRFPIFGGEARSVNNLLYRFDANSTDSFIYLSEWNNAYGYVYPLDTGKGTRLTYCPFSEVTAQVGDRYDTVYATSRLSTIVYIPPMGDEEINRNPPAPPIYEYEYSPVYVFSIAVAGLMALALSSMLITRRERLGPR